MTLGFVDVPGLAGTVQEKIFEKAERLAREINVAKPLVENKSDLSDMRPRQYNMRPTLEAVELGEHDDLTSPQDFDSTAGNTVTPVRIGSQVFLTDPRAAQDEGVQNEIAFELASAIALKDEIAILTAIAGFGETIGDGSGETTLEDLRKCVSILNTRGHRMKRKIAVLDEWQYFPIAKALDANGTPSNVSEQLKSSVQGAWYVTSLGDLDIYVTSNTVKSSETAAKGGVFVRDAILYDERKAFHMEVERDASRQGVEINAHIWRGVGLWAPERGITLHGKITVPSLT